MFSFFQFLRIFWNVCRSEFKRNRSNFLSIILYDQKVHFTPLFWQMFINNIGEVTDRWWHDSLSCIRNFIIFLNWNSYILKKHGMMHTIKIYEDLYNFAAMLETNASHVVFAVVHRVLFTAWKFVKGLTLNRRDVAKKKVWIS